MSKLCQSNRGINTKKSETNELSSKGSHERKQAKITLAERR